MSTSPDAPSSGDTPVGSGGEVGNGDESTPSPRIGYFVDAPVKGLRFETATLEGTTDELGRFEYRPGETVTFRLGATELGTTEGQTLLTPSRLDSSGAIAGNRATNIGRLLITLDTDQNPDNGIEINEAAHGAFSSAGFDMTQSPESLENLSALQTALDEVGREGLVITSRAREHMEAVASRLPSIPTEKSIQSLVDMGPQYTGRQSLITAEPEQFRQAAHVLWANPDRPDLDFYWLRQWVDPGLFHELAVKHQREEPLPQTVSVAGPVSLDGEGAIDHAELEITFDDHQYGQWLIQGVVTLTMDLRRGGLVIEFPDDPQDYEFDIHGYELAMADMRFSNGDKTFGVDGQIDADVAIDNANAVIDLWGINVVMREVWTDRYLKLQTESPLWYSRYKGSFEEDHYQNHELSGEARVLDSKLGAYSVHGYLDYAETRGIVEAVDLDILDDNDTAIGSLRSINLPNSGDLQRRVRSEVDDGSENPAYEVYAMETPFTGETLEDVDPVWVFDSIKYEVLMDDSVEPKPTGISMKLPPFAMDPDGDPGQNSFSWIVDGELISIEGSKLPATLDLGPDQQTPETDVCIRTKATFGGFTMVRDMAVDLEKTSGTVHEIPFGDAPCPSAPT